MAVWVSPLFLSLLLEMISGLPVLPPWIPEVHRKKMAKEVVSVSVKHSLLIMATTEYLSSFCCSPPVKQLLLAQLLLSLQIVVQLEPGSED